jgi:type I restriction enzyme, R subunit
MRQELVKLIPEAASNRRYVVRITSDDPEGKAQLSYFIDNDEPYPVIATTSKLLTTGVDAKTCKLIVLDQTINSMTEFKQIVGRGTRIREDYRKLYFTIMDFKGATRLFLDPEFDGEPVRWHGGRWRGQRLSLRYPHTRDSRHVPHSDRQETAQRERAWCRRSARRCA